MTIRIEADSEQRCRAIVDGNMTIYEAAADKSVLLDALARSKETEIDLSSVREIDTAGLQLLILAKRESLKAGTRLRVAHHSAASLDVVQRYGLGAYFAEGVGKSAGRDAVATASRPPTKRRPKATPRQRKSRR
jgi:anti-anti-sigma regulatory factor